MNEIADRIEKAADVIRVNGLQKGALWPGHQDDDVEYADGRPVGYEENWPTCAWGALYVVSSSSREANETGRTLIRRMFHILDCELDDDQFDSRLADWNDNEEITQEIVVDTLLQVAKDLRNES